MFEEDDRENGDLKHIIKKILRMFGIRRIYFCMGSVFKLDDDGTLRSVLGRMECHQKIGRYHDFVAFNGKLLCVSAYQALDIHASRLF